MITSIGKKSSETQDGQVFSMDELTLHEYVTVLLRVQSKLGNSISLDFRCFDPSILTPALVCAFATVRPKKIGLANKR
jgi:hypothetical protein